MGKNDKVFYEILTPREKLLFNCLVTIFLQEKYIQNQHKVQNQNKVHCAKTVSSIKCDALCDLVSFAQFKKREKHPWRCFSRFLNCTNVVPNRAKYDKYESIISLLVL